MSVRGNGLGAAPIVVAISSCLANPGCGAVMAAAAATAVQLAPAAADAAGKLWNRLFDPATSTKILQSGGRTIQKNTARALNDLTGRSLPAREWGRALEALKIEHGLSADHHGKIGENGDYLDDADNVIDSILDYIP